MAESSEAMRTTSVKDLEEELLPWSREDDKRRKVTLALRSSISRLSSSSVSPAST